MSGKEAANELRRKYGNKVKIILLTGNVTSTKIEGVETLFDGILTKPCSKKDLADCISFLPKDKLG